MTGAVRLTEAEFQGTVLDLARATGWRVAHFRPARTAHGWRTPVAADATGFFDLVLMRERVIFAELKSDAGRLTRDQQAWLRAAEKAGAEYYLWRPSDWKAIQEALR